MEGNLNRRSFVKGAALRAAGLIAGGALAACSPAAGTSESKSDSAQTTGANNAEQRWSFEIAPDPIGDDLVTETVETDVVVVGGGMSGLVAAASCAENGLKVTLISASKAPVSRGGSNNGRVFEGHEEMGIPARLDPTWTFTAVSTCQRRQLQTGSVVQVLQQLRGGHQLDHRHRGQGRHQDHHRVGSGIQRRRPDVHPARSSRVLR